jgi:hypothetical protein
MSFIVRGPMTIRAFAFFAVTLLGLHQVSASKQRVALMIGNAVYQQTPHLANPNNDASNWPPRSSGSGSRSKGSDLDDPADARLSPSQVTEQACEV